MSVGLHGCFYIQAGDRDLGQPPPSPSAEYAAGAYGPATAPGEAPQAAAYGDADDPAAAPLGMEDYVVAAETPDGAYGDYMGPIMAPVGAPDPADGVPAGTPSVAPAAGSPALVPEAMAPYDGAAGPMNDYDASSAAPGTAPEPASYGVEDTPAPTPASITDGDSMVGWPSGGYGDGAGAPSGAPADTPALAPLTDASNDGAAGAPVEYVAPAIEPGNAPLAASYGAADAPAPVPASIADKYPTGRPSSAFSDMPGPAAAAPMSPPSADVPAVDAPAPRATAPLGAGAEMPAWADGDATAPGSEPVGAPYGFADVPAPQPSIADIVPVAGLPGSAERDDVVPGARSRIFCLGAGNPCLYVVALGGCLSNGCLCTNGTAPMHPCQKD